MACKTPAPCREIPELVALSLSPSPNTTLLNSAMPMARTSGTAETTRAFQWRGSIPGSADRIKQSARRLRGSQGSRGAPQLLLVSTGLPLTALPSDAICQCSSHGIGQADEHGTEQQRSSRMYLAEDQELRNDVQENCNCHQVANRSKRTSQQFPSAAAMECQAPQEWGRPGAGIFQAIPPAQQQCHYRLKDESHSAGSRKAGDHVFEEAL